MLLVSGDGVNWQPAGSGLRGSAVQTLAFGSAFLAGTDQGLFWSTNGGFGWHRSIVSGGIDGSIKAIAINPTNRAIAYIGQPYYLLHTSDGGKTARKVTPTGLPTGFTAQAQCSLLTYDPSDAATLYAGFPGVLFKSTNGGANWLPVGQGLPTGANSVNALLFQPGKSSRLFAGYGSQYGGSPGGVYSSTDGGATWTQATQGAPKVPVLSLAFNPTNAAAIFAGTYSDSSSYRGGLYRSDDDGATWNKLFSTPFSIPSLAFDATDPGTLLVGTQNYGGSYGYGIYRLTADGLTQTGLKETAVPCLVAARDALFAGANGAKDGFIAELGPDGKSLRFATYLGGTGLDEGQALAWHAGQLASVGKSSSSDLFTTPGAVQPHTTAGSGLAATRDDAFAGPRDAHPLGGKTVPAEQATVSFAGRYSVEFDCPPITVLPEDLPGAHEDLPYDATVTISSAAALDTVTVRDYDATFSPGLYDPEDRISHWQRTKVTVTGNQASVHFSGTPRGARGHVFKGSTTEVDITIVDVFGCTYNVIFLIHTAPAPPTLQIQVVSVSPAALVLGFLQPPDNPAPPILESSATITGPFIPVPILPVCDAGGHCLYSPPLTDQQQFYRLKLPQ